jgi:hypothetical protein
MAKKKAQAPREPQEEAIADNTLGSTEDVFANLLGLPDKPQKVTKEEEEPPESTKESPSSSVDEYIRRQVLIDMYGTDTPSEHDKITLAIKKLL